MANTFNDHAVRPKLSTLRTLIVADKLRDALGVVSILDGCGFELGVAASFSRAKSRMNARPPVLLITELRLGEFNGLHLVLHGKSLRPSMAAVVVSDVPDPVLQLEAEQMGATFIVKPLTKTDLRAILWRMMCDASSQNAPIRPPFERRRSVKSALKDRSSFDVGSAERRRDSRTLLRVAAALFEGERPFDIVDRVQKS